MRPMKFDTDGGGVQNAEPAWSVDRFLPFYPFDLLSLRAVTNCIKALSDLREWPGACKGTSGVCAIV